MTAAFLHGALKCRIAAKASGCFTRDRRGGALELLLTTPLTVQEILKGHLRGFRNEFLWPLATILVLDGLLLMAPVIQDGGSLNQDTRLWARLFLVVTVHA